MKRAMHGPGRGAWLLAAMLLLATAHTRAEETKLSSIEQVSEADRKRARDLMDVGDAKMEKGDVEGALIAYRAADDIVRVPTTGIEVGRALQELGQWVEARDTWVRVALYPKAPNEPKPFALARQEAERLASELGRRIPTLIVVVNQPVPQGLVVWLDDRLLASDQVGKALSVNPGLHHLRTNAPGYAANAADIDLVEGTERKVTLSFRKKPKPPPAPAKREPWLSTASDSPARERSTALMWSGFSLALTGAVVGTATGIWAFERTAMAYEQCSGTTCPESAAADIDQAHLAGTISTVSFVLGGVGLALGTWQAITLSSKKPSAHAASPARGLALVPSGAGARLVLRGGFP